MRTFFSMYIRLYIDLCHSPKKSSQLTEPSESTALAVAASAFASLPIVTRASFVEQSHDVDRQQTKGYTALLLARRATRSSRVCHIARRLIVRSYRTT